MKSLEIKPLEGKKLKVLMVEKEYSEPFWIVEPQNNVPKNILSSRFKPSLAFCNFFEKLVGEVKPDFITEELGNRSAKEFSESNVLAEISRKFNVPFFAVDMDENAKGYIASLLEEKKQLRDRILKAIDELPENSPEREYLIAYGQCLQQEIEEAEREVKFSVRESWIAMGILENARKIDKSEVVCVHLSSPEHVNGVKKLLESVDVDVETIHPTKKLFSQKRRCQWRKSRTCSNPCRFKSNRLLRRLLKKRRIFFSSLTRIKGPVHSTSAWPMTLDLAW
jgi:hypothetical protein